MKKQFATIELGESKYLGLLEIEELNLRCGGVAFYWHFSTPDYLGNNSEVIKLTSCYKHIETKLDLNLSLSKHMIKF